MQIYRDITEKAKHEIKKFAFYYSNKINQYSHWIDIDDLCQEGYIGYITAKNDDAALTAAKRRMIDIIRLSYPGGRRRNCVSNFECGYDEKILETFLAPERASQEDNLQVKQVLEELPERERTIVGLYYAGYTEKEIGKKINLTESRICQIRKNIKENTYPKIMEIKAMARNLKTGTCIDCNQIRPIYAKGRCVNCYEKNRRIFTKQRKNIDCNQIRPIKENFTFTATLGDLAIKKYEPQLEFDTNAWKQQLEDALADAFQKGFEAGKKASEEKIKCYIQDYIEKN
jgi:RNA polymerase sigma factor (sigma-70 family)